MICNSEICIIFTCCCKCHTTKQLGCITFCRYSIVFFHYSYSTICRIIRNNIIRYIEINLTICIHSCCQTNRWINALLLYKLCIQFCQKIILFHLSVFQNTYKCIVIIAVFLISKVNQCLIIAVSILCVIRCQFVTNDLILC